MLNPSQRLLSVLFVGLPVLVLGATGLYMLGMSRLEDDPRGFWQAFEWAVETLTTTGYGADARWNHPAMILFVTSLQFVGVFLVFLVVPVFLIRLLEQRFELKLPRVAPKLRDHVVIYRYGPAVSTLMDEIEAAKVPGLVIEPDEHQARQLLERGRQVIFAGVEDQGLEGAGLKRARALIANGGDAENAAFILAARQLGFTGEILALVEEPIHRKPILLAGASAVYTPRHVLAAVLAARASEGVSPTLPQRLRPELAVHEVLIHPRSPLAGKTMADAALRQVTGATVVGQWSGSQLVTASPSLRIGPRAALIAVGKPESLEQLTRLAGGRISHRREGTYVVAGYGEVGHKVVELLRDAGDGVRVIDRNAAEGVDLVGDVLDHQVLVDAAVEGAKGVILALERDDDTLFATVCVRDIDADVPVFARVNHADNVENIHQAGADFALSLSQVSGQILARRLLDLESVGFESQLRVLRTQSSHLDGRRATELAIRERTGTSVVAVERGGGVIVDLGDDFTFAPGDRVYVCGDGQAVRRFSEVFPSPQAVAV